MSWVDDLVGKPKATSTGTPKTTSSGSKSSGTKSSGTKKVSFTASTATKPDPYIKFLKALGISPTTAKAKAAIAWAVANEPDSAWFERHIRQTMTAAYMGTWRGKQDKANFLTRWQTYFPGAKPTRASYLAYIKSDMNAAQQDLYIRTPQAFKKQYVAKGYNIAGYALRRNPAEFQRYAEDFAATMKQYGLQPTNAQAKLFFGGHQTPDAFQQAAETVFGGKESYGLWTGAALTPKAQQTALFNQPGALGIRQQILKAYNARTEYNKAKPAEFGVSLGAGGTPVQQGIF